MRKAGLLKVIAVMTVMLSSMSITVTAQTDGYKFNHGPYLQGLSYDDVHIFFTTSEKGFSKVQVRKTGSSDVKDYVTVNNGQIEAYNTMNAIKVDGLEPATEYEYRLVSKEMKEFLPYKVTYGETIESSWYKFRTLDPAAKSFSFVTVADVHGDSQKLKKLLAQMPMEQAQMVFFNGDVISHFENENQVYDGYVDACVEVFAKEKPFVLVRGNHETRGNMAREYYKYGYRKDGKYYGLYPVGETVVVMLDCGEDKPDSHEVYAGINAFDKYRQEQAEWLKKAMRSDEFKNAKRKIVMIHIPPISLHDASYDENHGARHITELFMPILNSAGIDLMICGHTHWSKFIEKGQEGNNFPIVIDDNKSASFVTSSQKGIEVVTKNINGEVIFNKVFQ